MAGDPGGVVDGCAEELLAFAERVTGVDADPNPQRRRYVGVLRGDAALDRFGTRHGPPCAGEREHRSVALSIDDRAVMRRSLLLDGGMVLSQKTNPVLVAETSEQDRGVDDVGEDDRHGSIRSEDS